MPPAQQGSFTKLLSKRAPHGTNQSPLAMQLTLRRRHAAPHASCEAPLRQHPEADSGDGTWTGLGVLRANSSILLWGHARAPAGALQSCGSPSTRDFYTARPPAPSSRLSPKLFPCTSSPEAYPLTTTRKLLSAVLTGKHFPLEAAKEKETAQESS